MYGRSRRKGYNAPHVPSTVTIGPQVIIGKYRKHQETLFIYDFFLGIDYRDKKQLPREFRNLKTHIVRHIETNDSIHADAV